MAQEGRERWARRVWRFAVALRVLGVTLVLVDVTAVAVYLQRGEEAIAALWASSLVTLCPSLWALWRVVPTARLRAEVEAAQAQREQHEATVTQEEL